MSEHGSAAGASVVRPKLVSAVEKFNERARTDPKLQETLRDLARTIQLDIAGDATYHFFLKNNAIDGVRDGPVANPQVIVTTDKDTLVGIMDGEVSATRAYFNKKIKFKATLQDLLVLRKIF